MNPFERVKKLANAQKITIARLEEKLGFGKNYLYKWKNSSPNSATLQKVADYFHVSTDYLLGRTTNRNPADDHIDVEDIVNDAAMLTSRNHELSEEDRDAIKAMLTTYLNTKEGQKRLKKYGGYGTKKKSSDAGRK